MMFILTLIVEVALVITFTSFSFAIATRSHHARALLNPLPTSRPGRWLVAAGTALPGIGMAIAILVPFMAFFAAVLSLATAASLAAVNGFAGRGGAALISVVIAIAAVGVGLLQPLGLRVLSLPKAADLPYAPVSHSVVQTYDPGVWFESVRAGSDGTLYLAANRDLDFSSSPYYRRARGSVIARRLDGSERTIFETPVGSTAGVLAVAEDGTIYLTSNGDAPSIWRIGRNMRRDKIANLPRGAWPNGLDFGPDGKLYAPDSSLACIWRIDPDTGHFEKALMDKRLAARPFVALAPGANGLHFTGHDMIVTVSDSIEVLKYRLGDDGNFGAATLVAKGIPGDDFAIGPDGALFITTHPYNTVVRVGSDGRRTVIADSRQHIVGATDATFGRGPTDRDTLYVATDGGAFTGGAATRGELVALRPYAQ